jgi:hypothetical protein
VAHRCHDQQGQDRPRPEQEPLRLFHPRLDHARECLQVPSCLHLCLSVNDDAARLLASLNLFQPAVCNICNLTSRTGGSTLNSAPRATGCRLDVDPRTGACTYTRRRPERPATRRSSPHINRSNARTSERSRSGSSSRTRNFLQCYRDEPRLCSISQQAF